MNGKCTNGTKTLRVPEDLHAAIKIAAARRRLNLEFFTVQILRLGLRGVGKTQSEES